MKINKVMAPGLIAVFSLFFSLISFGQGQQGVSIDKIIARVDNHYILNSELEEMYTQYKAEGRAAPEKCQLLESLIINKMLLAKAEIDSVVVEDKEVDGELDAKMGYMVQRFGSEKNIVEAYGKSIENLKSELRTQVKEQKIVEKCSGPFPVMLKSHRVKSASFLIPFQKTAFLTFRPKLKSATL